MNVFDAPACWSRCIGFVTAYSAEFEEASNPVSCCKREIACWWLVHHPRQGRKQLRRVAELGASSPGVICEGWCFKRAPTARSVTANLRASQSLLVVWGTDFDRDVRARLVRQLRGWKNEYPDDPNVQMYVVRCLHLIRPMGAAGTEIQTLNLPYLRVVFAKGVASCNFPGCAELAANTTLRACSRCKVYYVSIPGGGCNLALPFAYEVWTQCSANHQQQDWKKHKPFCITPAF